MSAVVVTLVLGAVGLLILGIQPLLYGAYVKEGILSEQALGLLGAAEVTAIAVGSGIAIPLLRQLRSAWVGAVGIMLMVGANLALPDASGIALLIGARTLCGLGEGLVVGIASSAIARSQRVASLTGAFLLAQATSQFAVMQAFAAFQPSADSRSVQLVLACAGMACLLLLPMLPRLSSRVSPAPDIGADQPNGPGIIGLIAMFLFVGGAVGIWAYAGLWLESRGLSAAQATSNLAASLAGQMIGALAATLIGDGRRARSRFTILTVALLGVIAAWLARPDAVFLALAFGLVWQAATPALASVLVEIDPRRRALPFAAAAQLGGIAIIPTIVGFVYGAGDLDTLLIAFAMPIALSVLLILTQARALQRSTNTQAAPAGRSHELGSSR